MRDVLVDISLRAGKLLRERFFEISNGRDLKIEEKAKNDFVTEIDVEIEEFIKGELAKYNIPIVGEETSNITTYDTYIIVDPIDGTRNFMRKNPHFAVNIALICNKEPTIAITYDPLKEEFFFAEKGKGAFLNGEKILSSQNDDISKGIVALGLPYRGIEILERMMEVYRRLYKTGCAIRHTGSAALDLAYVACGRYDAMVEFFLSPWDVIPGILLVKEAGGKIDSIMDKKPEDGWIIAGGKLFEKVYNIVNDTFNLRKEGQDG